MRNYVAICHVIASIVSADGIIDASEREFLEEAMNDFGLTEEERTKVRNFKNEGAEKIVADMPMNFKLALRDGMVEATLADGKISPYETKVVEHMTKLMGI